MDTQRELTLVAYDIADEHGEVEALAERVGRALEAPAFDGEAEAGEEFA